MSSGTSTDDNTTGLANAGIALLCLALAISSLAVGAVHSASVAALGPLLALSLALGLALAHRRHRPDERWLKLKLSPWSIALGLFASLGLLQLIPLPLGLLEWLSPESARLYQQGWELLGASGGPPARPISLDPQASADRALRALTLLLGGLAAASFYRERRADDRLMQGFLLVGVLVFGVGALQYMTRAEAVLWLYTPRGSMPRLSTYVSHNHAAVFYGLASLTGWGLMARELSSKPRRAVFAAFAAIVMLVAMLTQGSLGASLGYVLTLPLLIAWRMREGFRKEASLRQSRLALALLSLGLVAMLALIVASFLGQALIGKSLGGLVALKTQGRAEMLQAALESSTDFWLLGSGLGSTAMILPARVDWSSMPSATLQFVENDLAELLLTLGYLPTIALCSLIVLGVNALARSALLRKRGSRRGLAMILASSGLYMVLMSLFHFPWFALGISLPVIALVELGQAKLHRSDSLDPRWWAWEGVTLKGPAAVIALLLLSIGWTTACALSLSQPPSLDRLAELEPDAPAETFVRQLVDTPTAARLYLALAEQSLEANRLDEALGRGRHAWKMSPQAPYLLSLARLEARAGNEEKATARYAQLFEDGRRITAANERIELMLRDLPRAAQRADVLKGADPDLWRPVLDTIGKRDGALAAMDFAQELESRMPKEREAQQILLRAYLRSGRYALAELAARSLLLQRPEDSRAQLALVESLEGQGRAAIAQKVERSYFERYPESDKINARILQRRPKDPAQSDDELARLIERAQIRHCHAPLPAERRALCIEAQAWVQEYRGELDQARWTLERLGRQEGQHLPLGYFLLRQRRCEALGHLLRKRQGAEDPETSGLHALHGRCEP